MTDLDVREVPESELDRVLDLADMVFHQATREEGRERLRWMPRRAARFGVYESETLVGFMAALPMRLSVPGGGALDCGGVTLVGVLPTHRRRGVLSALMERLWADSASRGRPLAALYASEGAIYGRYGYGVATEMRKLGVDTRRPLELRIVPDPRPVRLLQTTAEPESGLAEAARVLAPMYARACARRGGLIERDPEWWAREVLAEVHPDDDKLTVPRVVVLEGAPGEPSGYAIYRTRSRESMQGDRGAVHLEELEADTPAVEAALWRYLASIDLTDGIEAWARPVDDLLPSMVADPFQVSIERQWRGLWLRLVDVKAALEGRGWAASDRLVLRILDERVPANQGSWRLETAPGGPGGPGGAVCEPTAGRPDLTVQARDLASVYLGSVNLGGAMGRLVRAGLADEHTAGAAARLDAALAVPLAPYTPDEF